MTVAWTEVQQRGNKLPPTIDIALVKILYAYVVNSGAYCKRHLRGVSIEDLSAVDNDSRFSFGVQTKTKYLRPVGKDTRKMTSLSYVHRHRYEVLIDYISGQYMCCIIF